MVAALVYRLLRFFCEGSHEPERPPHLRGLDAFTCAPPRASSHPPTAFQHRWTCMVAALVSRLLRFFCEGSHEPERPPHLRGLDAFTCAPPRASSHPPTAFEHRWTCMVAALVSRLLRFCVKARTNLNGLRIFEDWTPSPVLLRVPPRTGQQLFSTGGRAWLLLWSLCCSGFFL